MLLNALPPWFQHSTIHKSCTPVRSLHECVCLFFLCLFWIPVSRLLNQILAVHKSLIDLVLAKDTADQLPVSYDPKLLDELLVSNSKLAEQIARAEFEAAKAVPKTTRALPLKRQNDEALLEDATALETAYIAF
jgi:hypothetical protein